MADAIGTTTDVISGAIPKITGFGSSAVNWISWVVIVVLVCGLSGLMIFYALRNVRYNKTLIIYEKISGKVVEVARDRAMNVKFSTDGTIVWYLKKSKRYLAPGVKQMGKRVYWFYIREDQEWINFELADLDEEMRTAGAHFLDKEARFTRTQIQRGLKDRYDAPGFWKQHGIMIMNMTFIILILLGTWLLFDKWIDLAGATTDGVRTSGVVLDKVNNVMSQLDRICIGGKGYIPGG